MENKIFTMNDQNQESDHQNGKAFTQPQAYKIVPALTKTHRKPSHNSKVFYNHQQRWRGVKSSQKIVSQKFSPYYDDKLLQQQSFKKNWQIFEAQMKPDVLFQMMVPVSKTQKGSMLLKDGLFLVKWLKILATSEYINMHAIRQIACQKFTDNLQINQEMFFQYCNIANNSTNDYSDSNKMESENTHMKAAIKRNEEFNKETDDSDFGLGLGMFELNQQGCIKMARNFRKFEKNLQNNR